MPLERGVFFVLGIDSLLAWWYNLFRTKEDEMSERRQLSVKEEEKYIKLYATTSDISARNEIFYNLYPMAQELARKYSTDEFAHLKDDVLSVATSALLEGIDKYADHPVNFRGDICDYIRRRIAIFLADEAYAEVDSLDKIASREETDVNVQEQVTSPVGVFEKYCQKGDFAEHASKASDRIKNLQGDEKIVFDLALSADDIYKVLNKFGKSRLVFGNLLRRLCNKLLKDFGIRRGIYPINFNSLEGDRKLLASINEFVLQYEDEKERE